MKEDNKALFCEYVIDGITMESTPYEMLIECSDNGLSDTDHEGFRSGTIIDEQIDPPLSSFTYSAKDFPYYLVQVQSFLGQPRPFPITESESYTRFRTCSAIIDTLWQRGHFKSGNIVLDASWEWNEGPIGNMSAFYHSVYNVNEYTFDLGIRLQSFSYHRTDGSPALTISASVTPCATGEPDYESLNVKESPYTSRHAWTEDGRICPDCLEDDPKSWVIFIPFETCGFKLGGSSLAQINGTGSDIAPGLNDPDYTIDCYEVIRELIEDRIVVSGTTVADGGLIEALDRLRGENGISISLNGLKTANKPADNIHLLFAEVPGVLIQIKDSDYDYVDAQLLLQDVIYYPLGHPDSANDGITVNDSEESDVFNILHSLLSQASEGED